VVYKMTQIIRNNIVSSYGFSIDTDSKPPSYSRLYSSDYKTKPITVNASGLYGGKGWTTEENFHGIRNIQKIITQCQNNTPESGITISYSIQEQN